MLNLNAFAGPTITYTYDTQHRLMSADYSEVQSEAAVTYQYDAADNIDVVVSATDASWLKSFMIWLAKWIPDAWEPTWMKA